MNTNTININPDDIDTSKHLFNAFDNTETEISARWLVRFCQNRKRGWEPLTYHDINSFYSLSGFKDGFTFNRLIYPQMVPPSLARAFVGYHDDPTPVGGGWIIKDSDGLYHFTEEFIRRCYTSSPKHTLTQEQINEDILDVLRDYLKEKG